MSINTCECEVKAAFNRQMDHSCNNCLYNKPKYSIPNVCPKFGETVRGNCAFWRERYERLENKTDE